MKSANQQTAGGAGEQPAVRSGETAGPKGGGVRHGKALKRPTLIQVAALSGVKVSTASEILNRRPNCWASEKTRKRVFKAAKELNYRPNLAAKSLRMGVSNSIGMITVALNFGGPKGSVAGLNAAAAANRYSLLIGFNPNLEEMENQQILQLLDRGVDGLVVYPAERACHREMKQLLASGFPLVTINGGYLMDFKTDDVRPDFLEVGRLQARHLIELGRRRIALVNTTPSATINTVREKGVAEELARAGLPPPLQMTLINRQQGEISDSSDFFRQLGELVDRHAGHFDGLISVDSLAALAARAIVRKGLRIPQDVAVVGGGNSMLSTHGILPLTTVDTKDFWLGEQAFQLLLNRFENPGESHGFRQVVSEPELVVRESSFQPA